MRNALKRIRDVRLERGWGIVSDASDKIFDGVNRQRTFQMSRSHRVVEIFCRGIIGAKTYVLFKKHFEFGGNRSVKEILLGCEH